MRAVRGILRDDVQRLAVQYRDLAVPGGTEEGDGHGRGVIRCAILYDALILRLYDERAAHVHDAHAAGSAAHGCVGAVVKFRGIHVIRRQYGRLCAVCQTGVFHVRQRAPEYAVCAVRIAIDRNAYLIADAQRAVLQIIRVRIELRDPRDVGARVRVHHGIDLDPAAVELYAEVFGRGKDCQIGGSHQRNGGAALIRFAGQCDGQLIILCFNRIAFDAPFQIPAAAEPIFREKRDIPCVSDVAGTHAQQEVFPRIGGQHQRYARLRAGAARCTDFLQKAVVGVAMQIFRDQRGRFGNGLRFRRGKAESVGQLRFLQKAVRNAHDHGIVARDGGDIRLPLGIVRHADGAGEFIKFLCAFHGYGNHAVRAAAIRAHVIVQIIPARVMVFLRLRGARDGQQNYQ